MNVIAVKGFKCCFGVEHPDTLVKHGVSVKKNLSMT
jgi:hypothetical protein